MRRNRCLLFRAGLVMAVLGGIAPVIQAATVTTTLPVAATVGAGCTVSATGVSFGAFTGAAINGNGSIIVTCANGTPYEIALGGGAHLDLEGLNERTISNSDGVRLTYDLFQNSGLTLQWGDECLNGPFGGPATFPEGGCISSSGNGLAQVYTVFGRVFGPLNVSPTPGSYSDTVLVTVSF
jgi:spore coat protein U-like protein